MSDFLFAPNPNGRAMTEADFMTSALARQRDHEAYRETQMLMAIGTLVTFFLILWLVVSRRKIFDAVERLFVRSAARVVIGKRRMQRASRSFGDKVRDEVTCHEKDDRAE